MRRSRKALEWLFRPMIGHHANPVKLVFLLPAPALTYPPGGYQVVNSLAIQATHNGIETRVIVLTSRWGRGNLRNSNKSTSLFGTETVLRLVKSRAIIVRAASYLYRLVSRPDYDDAARQAGLVLTGPPRCLSKLKPEIVVGAGWATASIVHEYCTRAPGSQGYYLIQGAEDDVKMSGEIGSRLAVECFGLPLQKLVINSELMQRFVKDSPKRIHVGIERPFLKPDDSQIRPDHSVIFPWRLGASRGSSIGLKALDDARFSFPDLAATSFGEGHGKGLPHWVTHHRLPKRTVLRRLYSQASVFVFPSLVEGFPLPPLEAMGCGCVVVAFDIPGVREFVIDGFSGLLVPVGDHKAMAQAVCRILGDPELEEILLRNGASVVAQYTQGRMYDDFEAAIGLTGHSG